MNAAHINDVIARERAEQQRWERETVFGGYSVADMRVAFDAVCDPANWKYPIRASVSRDEAALTVAAISWFAGGGAVVKDKGGRDVTVVAPGYYRMIGA